MASTTRRTEPCKGCPQAERASWWRQMAIGMASLAGFLALAFAAIYAEAQLWPVYSRFEVTHIKVTPRGFTLSGVMDKRRDCALIDRAFHIADNHDPARATRLVTVRPFHMSDDSGPLRAPGVQPWGPWRFERIDPKARGMLVMQTTHRCHDIYYHTALYPLFPVHRTTPAM